MRHMARGIISTCDAKATLLPPELMLQGYLFGGGSGSNHSETFVNYTFD